MLHYPCRLKAAALLAGLAAMMVPAFGATITYVDRPTWSSASSGLTNIDFEGLAPANGAVTYNTSSGLTVDGVQFVGMNGAGFSETVYDAGFATPFFNFLSGASLATAQYLGASVPAIQITLPAGVTSIGVDLMTVSPNAKSFSVALSDGTNTTVATLARPSRAFFGATSDMPITTATFTVVGTVPSDGTQGLLDNFSFGIAGATGGGTPSGDVPEADTLLMIGTGLVGLMWIKRRAA